MFGSETGKNSIEIRKKRIRVYGIVQGVGFRPNTVRLARRAGVSGTVSNRGPYVEIIARGTTSALDNFIFMLKKEKPPRAVILKIDVKDVADTELASGEGFHIIESTYTKGEIYIPPDIAICEKCAKELYDPENPRYLHPFINCTSCGPRYTILEGLPYDRERTSMRDFTMCEACAGEYHDPMSRRYDAQPVCCNNCGPEVYLAGEHEIRGRDAIIRVRDTIRSGGIAAVKGIGGFHLCCDAADTDAVRKLRERKKRPVKPFAVMASDLKTALRECVISEQEKEILTGHQKPILLLRKKSGGKLSEEIAPDNTRIGMMLPYAPIHHLLFKYDDGRKMPDVLVMTSGNVSGAPICKTDEEAIEELAPIADIILSNNREIRTRADDTVMDFFDGKPYMVRRSRGYAPLPFLLSGESDRSVLAVGGELKNSFCVAKGTTLYPSAYVGDLEDRRSVDALRESIDRMEKLLCAKPEIVVSDMHPDYHSVKVAEQISAERGIPHIRVQHHHAHILSCMAENDWNSPVLGVAFDGTGYGTDGTVWGGEILQVDGLGDTEVKRFDHIHPFYMVGGDSAAREGWRSAVSMMDEIRSGEKDHSGNISLLAEKLGLCSKKEADILRMMREKGINSILSTSAGRLFDAVCAVLGICRKSTFEGEAAVRLETAAEKWDEKVLKNEVSAEDIAVMDKIAGSGENLTDSCKLFTRIVEKAVNGDCEKALTAYAFHMGLARQVRKSMEKAREATGINTAALSGGVFQNRLFLKLTEQELRDAGFEVLRHSMVPPNDGGIALGQAVAAVYSKESFKNGFSTEF
ncbi:hydrogenase maturation protein HypF [Lachnospiraceae bacterium]|nr:hydrogenase maturation protein HypF [Lachnospiraceae bacterium]